MTMDKNTFWQIIDRVNRQEAADDYDGILRATKEILTGYDPEEIADWGSIQRYYKDLANTGGVFAASCFLNNYMSDDGFNDFRMWLISRGKDVYMAALKDPDTLADLELPEDIQSTMDTRWEAYGYVANDAYEEVLPDGDIYDMMEQRPLTVAEKADIRVEIEYFPHDIRENITGAQFFPKLYGKYDTSQFRYSGPFAPKPGTSRFYTDAAQIAAQYGYRAEVSPKFESAVDILGRDGKRICAVSKRVGIYPDSFTTLPKNKAFSEMLDEIRNAMEHFDYREHDGHFDHANVREPSIIDYFEQASELVRAVGLTARLDDETDEMLEIQNTYGRHVAKVDGFSGDILYNGLMPENLKTAIQSLRLMIPFENDPDREAGRLSILSKQQEDPVLMTKDNIEADRKLYIEGEHINAYIAGYFDVDARFGTQTYGTDDYLNIYANYFPETEELEVGYTLITADGSDRDFQEVEVSDSEKEAIIFAMKEAGLDKCIAEMNEDQDTGITLQ